MRSAVGIPVVYGGEDVKKYQTPILVVISLLLLIR